MSGKLSPDEYLEYYEKYLANKKIQQSNLTDKKCFICQNGHLELTESEKHIILNCHTKSCDSWKLQLPTYYLFEEIIPAIENNPKLNKDKKTKEIKKFIDSYNSINDIDNRRTIVESAIQKYNTRKQELNILYNNFYNNNIDFNNYTKESAQLNKELIEIKKELSDILDLFKFNSIFVADTIKPRKLKI